MPRRVSAGSAAEFLRLVGGQRRCHVLPLCRARACAGALRDRPSDRQYADLHSRRVRRARAHRRAGRNSCGRRLRGPRLPASPRADRRAFRGRSVSWRRPRADVQDRRPGLLAGGRQHRLPGPQRSSGEAARLPHRARRDRGTAGRLRGRARSGGADPRRRGRRAAAGRLLQRSGRVACQALRASCRRPCPPTWCPRPMCTWSGCR